MTENGDPYENAPAERVNGIIKSEFNLYHSSQGLEQTEKKIRESIESYNTIRPHLSCDFLTPEWPTYKAEHSKNIGRAKTTKYMKKNLYSSDTINTLRCIVNLQSIQ